MCILVRIEPLQTLPLATNPKLVAKSSDYRNRPITISNVATYSFSLFEDGSFGFWAAGQAGWFELKSAAKDFKKTFAGMKEATGMFYYLADKYKNSRAKYSGASAKVLQDHVVKRLFNNYIYSEYCQRESLESITEGFYHHREFLMKSMLEGQEGLPWLDSPVLRHYRQKFPDEYKAIKEIGETTQIGQIPKQSTSTTVGALAQASKAAIREEENTFKQPLVWEVEMLDDVALIENSENEQSDYMSDSHKRESILRPRSNRASKKFMSRRENTRSASKKEASQNDEIEDGDSCIRVVDNLELATQPEPTRSLPPQIKKKTKKVAQSSKHGVWSNDAKTPLPAYYEPRGPGDTWICPYDGCMRKVWDARGAASVEMIKDHWVKTHANDAESLISEESRPWVSVE